MKELIKSDIARRLEEEVSVRNPVKFLKDCNIDIMAEELIKVVYMFTRGGRGTVAQAIFAEIITETGHNVRKLHKLPVNSNHAAKAGAFLLYTFDKFGIVSVDLGKAEGKRHGTYFVNVIDDKALTELWESVEQFKDAKMPCLEPPCPFYSFKSEEGMNLVKTKSKRIREAISPDNQPMVFDMVNKAQGIGWIVNTDILEVAEWAFKAKSEAFSEIWSLQNPEAKATKKREAQTIIAMSSKLQDVVFYHRYYLDFRGRKYPRTAYLHEQGSDLARGLLLREDSKPLRESGLFWLLVTIASNWAGDSGRYDGAKTDKIPLKERAEWVLENESMIMDFAERPRVNTGWMSADKPWQFLAACIELFRAKLWSIMNDRDIKEYPCHLLGFIDGSNNGSQHLAALTRDELIAPYVNLVPSKLPGDLYAYVAEHVWETIEEDLKKIKGMARYKYKNLIEDSKSLQNQLASARPGSDYYKAVSDKLFSFKTENKEPLKRASPVFWAVMKDLKQRRKVVKRGVMTLPYGGSSYGLGSQVIEDAKKHGIPSLYTMDRSWGVYMGRLIYDTCQQHIKRSMKLLKLFEAAGKKAEKEGYFLSWTVPFTNFPVEQHYTECEVKKLWIQYGPPLGDKVSTGYYVNTLQVAICHKEMQKKSKGKQSQGAAPNTTHSLDAAHLTMTVDSCDKRDVHVTTIHDSFGTLLADMDVLNTSVREEFIRLHKEPILENIMEELDKDSIEYGNLDINLIKDSEYCFS